MTLTRLQAGTPRGVPASDGTRPNEPDTAFNFVGLAEVAFELPGYQITGHLGSGGMGHVFSAIECELSREVAIKVIRHELLDNANLLQRFTTEVRTTASLTHPCIPPVFAAGRLPDGRPYLVMKHLHGESLQCHLERRANTVEDLPRFTQHFLQICQAVAHAHKHKHKVIHRDLKPANVMIEKYGGVQVLDWGIAKQLKEAVPTPGFTVDGRMMGSLAYMPPEQFRGEWDRVDERADVFALGAILCVILTGHPPNAWGPEARANLANAVARIKAHDHEPGLIDVAVRCLSYDPADRPADAEAVVRLLEVYRAEVVARLRNIEVEKAVTAATTRREREQEIAALKERVKTARQRRRRLIRIGGAGLIGLALFVTAGIMWSKHERIGNAKSLTNQGRDAGTAGDRTLATDKYKEARHEYEALLGSTLLWNRQRLQFELAKVNTRLAELSENERDPAAAESALRQAQEQLEELRRAEALTRDELDLALAEVQHHWGIHFGNKSAHQKAAERYDESVRLRRGMVRPDKYPGYRRDLALAYGFRGDAYLELGDFAQAEQSYNEAWKLRNELAQENPNDAESQCLHARDFSNKGNLYARQGKDAESIKQCRARRQYYNDHLQSLPRLPGNSWLERAGTNCDIAEFLLQKENPTPEEVTEAEACLSAANTEYASLRETRDDRDCPSDLQSELARFYICQARLQQLKGASINEDTQKAIQLLVNLDDMGKLNPIDYYQMAVVHALCSSMGKETDTHRVLAIFWLQKANRKGFKDSALVGRDHLLHKVLGSRLQEVIGGRERPPG